MKRHHFVWICCVCCFGCSQRAFDYPGLVSADQGITPDQHVPLADLRSDDVMPDLSKPDLSGDTGSMINTFPDSDLSQIDAEPNILSMKYEPPAGPLPKKPTALDILFVIDNSPSMALEQVNLVKNFNQLIQGLLQANKSISSIHIGVISPDLGAGQYGLQSCEVVGGDGGKLQNSPRIPGCIPPKNPWIAYDSILNITNVPTSGTPEQQLMDGFACIAKLGPDGCGFEQPLEAAKMAVDPALNINPGFIRSNAMLAIVFITDEDDCSAHPLLYDPNNVILGPPTSYRCFAAGVTCTHKGNPIDLFNVIGQVDNCIPKKGYLTSLESYFNFFANLKPYGSLLLAAITAPPSPTIVGSVDEEPKLEHSCKSADGGGDPALRFKYLLDAFGSYGMFNPAGVMICSSDFGPALSEVGQKIYAMIEH